MSPLVHITAPSRLHFGLWSLGGAGSRQFGGVGAMVEQPALLLTATEATQFCADGDCAESVIEYARRWSAFHTHPVPPCRVTIEQAIPHHAGLGSGTQLALA